MQDVWHYTVTVVWRYAWLIWDLLEVADKITWLFGLTVKASLGRMSPPGLLVLLGSRRNVLRAASGSRLTLLNEVVLFTVIPVLQIIGGRVWDCGLESVIGIQPRFLRLLGGRCSLLSVISTMIMDYLTNSLCSDFFPRSRSQNTAEKPDKP